MNRKPKNRTINNYLDVINKMLAMLGFVSMAIISDDHFTTWFQGPVDNEIYILGYILFEPSMNHGP